MRIFLTGASGYLGSLLAERLAELPEVEGITGIATSKQTRPAPAKVKFLRMDMRSPQLPEVMAGHEVVVHTAAVVLWSRKMSVKERDDIATTGVRNMANAALAAKVKKFIHASSRGAYDPELSLGKSDLNEDFPLGSGKSKLYYWNSKAEAEKILGGLLRDSTALTFLRPAYIIGPRNRRVVESYQKNAVNILGCNARRQFIHEEDVADAFIRAVRGNMPGPFNVVPDDFIRLTDVWKIVGKKFVPTVPMAVAGAITTLRWRFLGSMIHRSWVDEIPVDFTCDNSRLKGTGWKPRCGSADALKSAL
jgi:nucleoside-diphosphate-sugar epimerase